MSLSSSAFTGGVPSIIAEFGASRELCTAGVSLFVVGFAFGPLIWAPCSEVFGRRNVFIFTYVVFTIFQAVTCASQNIQSILIFRFFAGFFGSSPLANGGGTITDTLDAKARGLGMAVFAAAPFLGPTLGPITGGFLGQAAGWRWVEGYLAIVSATVTAIIALISAETYAPFLLRQRAAQLSKATGKVYRYRADAKQELQVKELFKASLLRPWKFLLFEPIVIVLSIYIAIIYGVLYLNFAAYPIVFEGERGWSLGIGGLAFIGIMIGTLLSLPVSIWYINPQYVKAAKKRGGMATPEDRLPPAIWGGIVIVIGLAGFAATDGPEVHWIAPIIFGAPFGFGMIVVFLSVLGYLVDSYTIYAASVLAANSVLRSLFGAAFPLFTTQMYSALGIHWAAALPGFLALACVPAIFIFWKYGAAIRSKCKYAADAERQMKAIIAARMAARNGGHGQSGEEGKVEGRSHRSSSDATAADTMAATEGKGAPKQGSPDQANSTKSNSQPASPVARTQSRSGRQGFHGGSDLAQMASITSVRNVGPYPNEDPDEAEEFEKYRALAERDETALEDDARLNSTAAPAGTSARPLGPQM